MPATFLRSPSVPNLPGRTVRMRTRAAADALALLTAAVAGYAIAEASRWMLLDGWEPIALQSVGHAVIVLLLVPTLVVLGYGFAKGHYARRRPFWSETVDQLKSLVFVIAAIAVALFAAKVDFSRPWTAGCLAAACFTLPIGRLLARRWLVARGRWTLPTLIIDDGDAAHATALAVTARPDLGLEPVMRLSLDDEHGIDWLVEALEHSAESRSPADGAFGYLAETPHLIVSVQHMESLIAAKPGFDRLMQACPVLTFLPPMSGLPLYRSEMMPLFRRDNVMLRLHNGLRRRSSRKIKRAIDLLLGVLLAVVLSPVFLVICLLVRLDGGPAIFAHERIGEGGRRFRCLKFRTMVMDSDARLKALLATDPEAARSWAEDHKIKDDPRITRVGKFLRRSSLDELPQLMNVLRGQMSFVGPRPIVAEEIVRYGGHYAYYQQACPGITGLWQVSGRNDVSYAERVRLDVWYSRNWSPWLDVVVLLKTLPVVFGKQGAY